MEIGNMPSIFKIPKDAQNFLRWLKRSGWANDLDLDHDCLKTSPLKDADGSPGTFVAFYLGSVRRAFN